jgi:hypothetical protein
MDIKILIATHKQFDAPHDAIYLPIHVGKEGKADLGYIGDNTGDNISSKNPYYCELTGLYWAWKNLKYDYIGLVHYRRYLSCKRKNSILTGDEALELCKKYDIILPKKRYYIIETIKSQYAHAHDIEHLDKVRELIQKDCPDYILPFDKVMRRRSAHLFNMFIMKKSLADEYFEWLFNILFQLESKIDLSDLSPFQARLFGRVGERLLDVWIAKNKYSYKEINRIQTGSVNWSKKIKNFLLAKFTGVKPTESC